MIEHFCSAVEEDVAGFVRVGFRSENLVTQLRILASQGGCPPALWVAFGPKALVKLGARDAAVYVVRSHLDTAGVPNDAGLAQRVWLLEVPRRVASHGRWGLEYGAAHHRGARRPRSRASPGRR